MQKWKTIKIEVIYYVSKSGNIEVVSFYYLKGRHKQWCNYSVGNLNEKNLKKLMTEWKIENWRVNDDQN